MKVLQRVGRISSGVVGVTGNFTQGALGRLVVEDGGRDPSQFDQLQVGGQANLGGSLEVHLVDGYTPSAQDSFSSLAYNGVSGNFNSVSANTQVTLTSNGLLMGVDPNVPSPCSFMLTFASQSFSSSNGTGSVNLSAIGDSCGWTANSNAPWITITSAASGTGNGSVNYSVAANTTASARSGQISLGGQNFTIDQAPATAVQFSSPTFSVGEGDGNAVISVTRIGDTSGAATVDYQTTDTDNFTVNCSFKQGAAFGRCDFATVVGTLTWAAGDATAKTFTVPIINDAYAEGPETFSVVLSNATGALLGAPSTATVTINDNETTDSPNPILQTNAAASDFFVRQHYLDFLGREPEVGQPWSNVLNGCADQFNIDPNSPSAGCDRITVSGAFFGSPEFKTKGFYVINMYRVAFNRLPTYVEFSTDLASISGTTAAEVFAKRAAYATSFVQRPEFSSINNKNNSDYVTALMAGTQTQGYNLTTIHATDPANPDTGNKVTLTTADLINGLNGSTLTRAQVLRAIVQSDEISLQAEAINTFVASQYYGYLRRAPDTGGFNSWVNYMKANPNDFRTMVNGFVNSQEYRHRFGQ